jgi:hypothetical protein
MTGLFTEREAMLNQHGECLSISRHKESTNEDTETYVKTIAFPSSENERRAASHTAQVF